MNIIRWSGLAFAFALAPTWADDVQTGVAASSACRCEMAHSSSSAVTRETAVDREHLARMAHDDGAAGPIGRADSRDEARRGRPEEFLRKLWNSP